MNIYVVVEGEVGEKRVYQNWVPLVNPDLTYVPHISDIASNNFSIISGGGYPNYKNVIEAAFKDIDDYSTVDRLVIAADSEELSYEEKRCEIEDFISNYEFMVEVRIVIQHFCLETWALGNRAIIRNNPQCPVLAKYKRFYNVINLDPEALPAYQEQGLNRAQFAMAYLKRAVNDKYRNLTYNKSKPDVLLHPNYYKRVKDRYEQTGHLCSFNDFLSAFL